MKTAYRVRLGAIVTTLALLPTVACGSRSPSSADRVFVAAMIPHHHLGMRLLDEATQRSSDVRLRHLVFEMGNYHSTELAQLDQWATSWGVSPAANFSGSIPEPQLEILNTLRGLEHDTEWLSLMILHHEGALTIASAVSPANSLAAVRTLASSIRVAQTQQIVEMRALLDELCGEAARNTHRCSLSGSVATAAQS